MGDRLVVIIVGVLTLVVMCGLLLAAVMWVPARIDQLERRLDRLEELSTQVSVMHDQLGNLDKLEKKLSETALAAAPLARIDSSLDEVNKKLNEVVVPAVNDIKAQAVPRTDIERVGKQLGEIAQKLATPPTTDPELKKLAADVAELARVVDAMHKKLETTSRDVTKDVKQLQLEVQKLGAILKPAPAPTP